MHELSIVAGLFDILEEKAREHRAKMIVSVTIKVGKLSGTVPDLLVSAFDIYKEGTLAAEARLEIISLPVKTKCGNCGREFELEHYLFVCPSCASHDLKILEGMDLFIEKIEFEV
jgi:hydrogenase nickel incorporation protein HypA/HybF